MSELNETAPVSVLAYEIHRTAVEHGWWEDGDRNVGEVLMLMVSELSEAFEEHRKHRAVGEIYYVDGKPEGIPVELADVMIRILDFAWHYDIPIMRAMLEKMAYNDTRPYRHGGKRC